MNTFQQNTRLHELKQHTWADLIFSKQQKHITLWPTFWHTKHIFYKRKKNGIIKILDNWNGYSFTKVKLSLYKSGIEVKTMIFYKGSNNSDWMSPQNIFYSEWADVNSTRSYNYFGVKTLCFCFLLFIVFCLIVLWQTTNGLLHLVQNMGVKIDSTHTHTHTHIC